MSNPANPPANPPATGTTVPGPSNTGGATGVTSGGNTGGTTTTGATTTASSADEIVIYVQPFTTDNNWPAGLILDRSKGNWLEWDHRINAVVDQRCYGNYLDGSFPCPDPAVHAKAAMVWGMNNCALRSFLLEHVSSADYEIASAHSSSHDVYEALRTNHHNLGLLAQINIIREALDTHFKFGVPISKTIDDIVRLHTRFVKMGKIDDDQLLIIFLLNALCGDYSRLQTSVNDLLHNSLTTSRKVQSRLLREEQTINICDNQNPDNTVLAAISNKSGKPTRPLCSSCERPGHKAEFCIAEGGGMAGKTLEEARAAQAAQKAAAGNTNKSRAPCSTTTQSPATQSQSGNPKSLMVNGKQYMLVENTANTALTPVTRE